MKYIEELKELVMIKISRVKRRNWQPKAMYPCEHFVGANRPKFTKKESTQRKKGNISL
jgi:hypothetical protein